jgi:hypothetical protein
VEAALPHVSSTLHWIGDVAPAGGPHVAAASPLAWQSFLAREVAALLRSSVTSTIEAKVAQFNTAAQLASIQPRAAPVYRAPVRAQAERLTRKGASLPGRPPLLQGLPQ